MNKIKVIGIGLEGIKSLNSETRSIVGQATVLIGGQRHLDYFPHHVASKLKINNIKKVIEQIKSYDRSQENIVILATGDPLFFGIGRILVKEFPSSQLEFYPHLSCVQIAFNKLQIPWQSAKIISLHGRDIAPLINTWKKGGEIIAILTDKTNNPLAIYQLYQELQLPITYDFWLCENLGSPDGGITPVNSIDDINLDTIADLNILILKQNTNKDRHQINLDNLPLIGVPDALFSTFDDRPNLMTKKEIRTLILGQLELQPNQVIWDLGAGTGSVTVEMGRISKNSQIYAIEKTAIGASLIKENVAKFKVENVTVIHDRSENVINDLDILDSKVPCEGEAINVPFETASDPVCGCDDVTYKNAYRAAKAGIQVWTAGPCEDKEE